MTRRGFLAVLGIVCLAPVQVLTNLGKNVPARRVLVEGFVWASYMPIDVTPNYVEFVERVIACQPLPPRLFEDLVYWHKDVYRIRVERAGRGV